MEGEILQLEVKYEITASLTGLRELNAPFIKFENLVPLVDQRSGNMLKMAQNLFSLTLNRSNIN